jgi:hypothetical protein
MPTFWQSVWRGADIVSPPSEAVWALLSPDFQQAVLVEFRALQRRACALRTAVMLPLVVVVLVTCFWTGVRAAAWLGLAGGPLGEWLCGMGGVVILWPLRMLPAGWCVEGFLIRCRWERASHEALRRFHFIGVAVIRRCRLPWYLNPDVLFPAAVTAVAVSGLFFL